MPSKVAPIVNLPAAFDQRLLLNRATHTRLAGIAADGPLDLTAARKVGLALQVSGSELLLMALLNAALRLTVRRYLERRGFRRDGDRLRVAGRSRRLPGCAAVHGHVLEEYPLPERLPAGSDTVELFLLDVQLDNPALQRHRPLFDDAALSRRIDWRPLPARLAVLLTDPAQTGPWGRNLRDLLRDPLRAAPGDLAGQVAFVLATWGEWLPTELLLQLKVARAIALEEAQPRLAGPGPGPGAQDFSAGIGGDGPAAFSPDRDWMSSAVLIAKSVAVWLDQLGRQYGEPIHTLDQKIGRAHV